MIIKDIDIHFTSTNFIIWIVRNVITFFQIIKHIGLYVFLFDKVIRYNSKYVIDFAIKKEILIAL